MALIWLQLKSFFIVIVNSLLTMALFPYYVVMWAIGRPAKMILIGRHAEMITNMYKENYKSMHSDFKNKFFGGDRK